MASLHFCAECNNLLYPEVDNTNHVLLYACRTCRYRQEADANLVYRKDLMSVSKETQGVTENIIADPTLPRTTEVTCPSCHGSEAVFFQDQSKRIFNRMILFYVCTKCDHLFQDDLKNVPQA